MDPVTLTTTIARPREEVFAYLADIANHAEFTDHFLVDWRLTREDTYGEGAGARYRVKQPLNRFAFAEETITALEPPRRLVTEGWGGRYNRIRTVNTWKLEPGDDPSTTRVEFVTESEPVLPSDRLVERTLRSRGLARRQHGRALKRLRAILEDGSQRGSRATISGGPRKPATGFRM